MQAARQAALEKAAEVSQAAAPPPAAGAAPDLSLKTLPAGNSVHVDYNYFEVGTGQVNVTAKVIRDHVPADSGFIFNDTICSAGVSGLPLPGL